MQPPCIVLNCVGGQRVRGRGGRPEAPRAPLRVVSCMNKFRIQWMRSGRLVRSLQSAVSASAAWPCALRALALVCHTTLLESISKEELRAMGERRPTKAHGVLLCFWLPDGKSGVKSVYLLCCRLAHGNFMSQSSPRVASRVTHAVDCGCEGLPSIVPRTEGH